jgi:hypothetical protein
MPTKLFKYVDRLDVIPFILQGVCKFTPISELNDPSELLPSFLADTVAGSLEQVRRNGYSDDDMVALRQEQALFRLLAPHRQRVQVPNTKEEATSLIRLPAYDDLPLLERSLEATASEMASQVGVLCLSTRFDSLPMWAHYAGHAKMFAIEFASLDVYFAGEETGVLRKPRKVTYDREHSGVTFDPRSHESIFLSKYSDWQYESEYRVIMPLKECIRPLPNGEDGYFHQIPKKHICRVILGWKMSDGDAQTVRDRVREHNPDVEVVGTQIRGGRVELIPAAR